MNICDDAKRAKKKKRDSLFFKMFSPLIYFEQEKTIEKVSKKLYTSKLNEKKKKAETKNWVWDWKAQIFKSCGTRQVCVSVFFVFWSLCKTNRLHVAVGLFSNRSQRTKSGKNVSDTLACATSLYLPHFELLLNRCTATCNVFVKWNNIPLEIRSCESLNDFKNEFKVIS